MLGYFAINEAAHAWFNKNLTTSWPMPGWVAAGYEQVGMTGLYIFTGLVIFLAGWIAARWDWSTTWRESLLAGAGAGLLAGCLLYDFTVGAWAGLAGNQQILQNFSKPLTNDEGILLLSVTIYATGWQVYRAFFICLLSATLIGALGGLLSATDGDGWGFCAEKGSEWLLRIPAYTLTATGAVMFVITTATISILPQLISDAVQKINRENVYIESQLGLGLLGLNIPYWIGYGMIVLPLLISTGWMLRNWKGATPAGRIFSILWFFGWIGAAVFFGKDFIPGFVQTILMMFDPNFLTLFFILIIILIPAIIGLSFGLLKNPPAVHPERNTSAGDWFGYAVTQGILGGTQILAGLAVFAIVLTQITIINIPHLTNEGVVTSEPLAQIQSLYRIMGGVASGVIIGSALLSLIFGGFAALVRRLIPVKRKAPAA